MGKRSNFERKPRDFYPTPREALPALIPHLDMDDLNLGWVEPCAGDMALVNHLAVYGIENCVQASDIEPQHDDVVQLDALQYRNEDNWPVVTNPPWERTLLHQLIEHWRLTADYAWVLLDANWMFTKQAAPYMKYCSKVVAVGRLKWIPDSKMQGKDDCAWYKLENFETETIFVGRA